jgi:hypothetical protein
MADNNEEKKEEGSKTEDNNSTHRNGGIPVWIWIIIVILVLICLYFLSLINSKKFLITEKDGYLIVKKGLFLPYGFSEYIPQDIVKREAYAPLKVPPGESISTIEVDKGELDIALFKVISNWVEKYLKEEKEEDIKTAALYIERLMRLNVSPEEYERFSRLKGELIFKQAKFGFNMGLDMIRQSKEKIKVASNLSPDFRIQVEELLSKIERIEKALNPDFDILSRQDIERMREEIKKECISSCVKAAVTQPPADTAKDETPSEKPEKIEGR